MYHLNKIVGALTNPVTLAMAGVVLSVILAVLRRRRSAVRWLILSVAWAWVWSTPLVGRWLGATLEREFLQDGKVPPFESYPAADAIELHGGSMGFATNICARGEMWTSADRVWMAARLWKAGKAPRLFVTGTGCPESTIGLLEDFGVPTNAMVIAEGPRNTEEEARFVAGALKEAKGDERKAGGRGGAMPKVLVVTSAWHMKRTMLMYAKYASGIAAIPAPCDFENTLGAANPISILDFLPSAASLMWNGVAVHEWVGIWGYELFR